MSDALRQQVVMVYREIGHRGLIAGSSGNVSHRTVDGMIITPSGCSAETLQPDALVPMTLQGDVQAQECLLCSFLRLRGRQPQREQITVHVVPGVFINANNLLL